MVEDNSQRPVLPMAEELGAVLAVIKRYLVPVIAATALTFVLGSIWVFTRPTTFLAETSIMPTSLIRSEENSQFPGGLGGLSRRFGLNVGASSSNPSLTFQPILFSRDFFSSLAVREFPCRDGRSAKLESLLVGVGETSKRSRENAYARYKGNALRVVYNEESGVTTIGAVLPDPIAAAAVVNACVARLDSFTVELKQGKSREWRDFVQQRMIAVADSLSASEENLRRFREGNRDLTAPALRLEESRLGRRVEIQQELYLTLATQYEEAQLESLKDVSVITVIDRAVAPLEKYSPRRAFMIVILFIVSVAAGILVGIAAYVVAAMRPRVT